MKKIFILLIMVLLLSSCSGNKGNQDEPIKLETPIVTINEDGLASWVKINHASGYAYKINNGIEKTTNELSIELGDGGSIVVKAIGDGINYLDSDYSESKTYIALQEAVKLQTPNITINEDGLASWEVISGAVKYVYVINDGNSIETNELSVQLNDKDVIKAKAIGDGINYLDSDYSLNKTYIAPVVEPVKLDKPVVTINELGVASWESISGAVKYVYSINSENAKETNELSIQLYDGDNITVMSIGDGIEFINSDYSNLLTFNVTKVLNTPVISISEAGIASWEGITGAVKYAYSINGNTPIETNNLSIQLTNGDTIKVMAIGDRITYKNSTYSNEVTYTATEHHDPVKLDTPAVTISSSGIASWESITGAVKYVYSINSENAKETNELSIQLYDKDTIVVMAIGDGIDYANSEYSVIKTHQALALSTPIVTINEDGLASWDEVSNAIRYAYSINDNTPIETNNLSIQLDDDDIIKVMAIGDNMSYGNSEYSEPKKFNEIVKLTTPNVIISSAGIASWGSIENAVKYAYTINDDNIIEITELSVQLSDGDVIKVKAIGDNINYLDSDFSNELTYIEVVKLSTPNVTISSTGIASWNEVENAVKYAYSINDGSLIETNELSIQLTNGDTFKVKAIGNGVKYLDSDFSIEIKYTASTKLSTPTVKISNTGVASWEAVAGTVKYVYSINGGAIVETTTLSVQLKNGDSIIVKAIGDGINYLDSDYSESKKYTASGGSYDDGENWGPIF